MTTYSNMTDAIARSIAHNEIAHVDLTDALRIFRRAAISADDLDTAQTIEAILEPDSDEVDPVLASRKALRALIGQIVEASCADHTDVDSVENDDVYEVWGEDEAGDSYRVHIQMRGLMDGCC